LAFVRAQLLWNIYRMDPEWMLQLMERYGPLDWRLVQPHGLYWVTCGIHVCNSIALADINSLNTDRIVMNCLKALTWSGRLAYRENPRDADAPSIASAADWRFVESTQAEYLRIINAITETTQEPFKDNTLKAGHINYLVAAAAMLYAGQRRTEAAEYYQWIKDNYEPAGDEWNMKLEDFIVYRLNREGAPIPSVARNQLQASLVAAYLALSRDDSASYRSSMRYARRVYDVYQESAAKRNKLPPMGMLKAGVLCDLLVEPRILGYNVPLLGRVKVYARLYSLEPKLQVIIYDTIARPLKAQCRLEGLDFDKAFPMPAGLDEYRALRRRRLAPAKP
ncbi:MAG: hypothetical protein SVT52_08240, partial [Planctomycetota bacterium]|nr:hypothetical protein [Planctomycetota bacterium]